MRRNSLAIGAVIAWLVLSLSACTPPSQGTNCHYPVGSQRVVVTTTTNDALALQAAGAGQQSWNTLEHEGPTFASSGDGHKLVVAMASEQEGRLLGKQLGSCIEGGWTQTLVVFYPLIHGNGDADPTEPGEVAWVGAHEFGHALGLAHILEDPGPIDPSKCPGTVMWPTSEVFIACGQNTPGPGDVKAVNLIYD